MQLLLCGAVLSASEHAALRLATLKREYHMSGALALDADA